MKSRPKQHAKHKVLFRNYSQTVVGIEGPSQVWLFRVLVKYSNTRHKLSINSTFPTGLFSFKKFAGFMLSVTDPVRLECRSHLGEYTAKHAPTGPGDLKLDEKTEN